MKIKRFILIKGLEGVINEVIPVNTKEAAEVAFYEYTGCKFEELYDGNHEVEADQYEPSRIDEIEVEITDSELINYEEQEYLAVIRWCKEDLEDVFKNNGVDYTEENINKFIGLGTLGGLHDVSISSGWESLDVLVTEAINAGALEVTEEIEVENE